MGKGFGNSFADQMLARALSERKRLNCREGRWGRILARLKLFLWGERVKFWF